MSDAAWWYIAAVAWIAFFALVFATGGTPSRSQRRARRWLKRRHGRG